MKGHLAFDNKMFKMNLALISLVVFPLAFAYSKFDSSYFSLKKYCGLKFVGDFIGHC